MSSHLAPCTTVHLEEHAGRWGRDIQAAAQCLRLALDVEQRPGFREQIDDVDAFSICLMAASRDPSDRKSPCAVGEALERVSTKKCAQLKAFLEGSSEVGQAITCCVSDLMERGMQDGLANDRRDMAFAKISDDAMPKFHFVRSDGQATSEDPLADTLQID